MMVILARQLGPTEFGTFVVAFTALLLSNSMQGALLSQPHNVLGASLSDKEYASYTTATAIAQVAMALATGAVVAIIGAALLASHSHVALVAFSLALPIVTWQMQEFLRRICYTQFKYKLAFAMDLLTYGGKVGLLLLLMGNNSLSVSRSLITIGVASLAGSVVGAWNLRPVLFHAISLGEFRSAIRNNWSYGRWLLGVSVTYWLSTQLYPILTAGFIGLSATGGVRAAQNLMGPAQILQRSFDSIALTKATAAYKTQGISGLHAVIRTFSFPVWTLLLCYCIVVAALSTSLMDVFFGPKFEQYAWLVAVYALCSLLSFASTTMSVTLRSLSMTRTLFRAQAYAAVAAISIGPLLVKEYGLSGLAGGMLANNALIVVFLWTGLKRASSKALHIPTQDRRRT